MLKEKEILLKFACYVLIAVLPFFMTGCTNISDLAEELNYKSGAELVADAKRAHWPFEYSGSFNVPDESGFNYVKSGFTYNAQGNGGSGSFYITGHDWYQEIAEITRPEAEVNADVTLLPVAEVLQNFTGKIHAKSMYIREDGSLLDVSVKIGGLLVYGGKLYGSAYAYYSGASDAKRSHFKTSLDLSDSSVETNFKGMFTIGNLNPGKTGGYMCLIPVAKRHLFGGASALTGQAGICIITRSSFGPSLHTFSPENMTDPGIAVSSRALVYYPGEHQNLGTYGNSSEYNPTYNMSTAVSGVIYPENSEYVYVIGTTGLGIPFYGAGTNDPDLHLKPMKGYPDVRYYYDPVYPGSKGPHAWPYVNYLWIYHEDDLVAVYNGTIEPWDIKPVCEGVIDLPYYDINRSCGLSGVTYDSEKGCVYISAKQCNGTKPVVHVYKTK